jgi:hypothetical protein
VFVTEDFDEVLCLYVCVLLHDLTNRAGRTPLHSTCLENYYFLDIFIV